ncbi:alpha/beta hydrolase-fold protein [Anaeromyxobacter terrae]|uniref:alpha/beta hydrolase-fold protein n=1 Tax=Anaeromyxobacter terrae TaxID=2925406 RepID=UPI001F5ACEDA|nr:alpha/beta hydrolase-fold protein [Anaeromyxobacter sp. SG22]
MKLLAAALLAAAAPALAQDLSVRVVTLKSPALGEERTVYVLTPPGYAHGERRYPVVYFTDGERTLPLLATTARFLASTGRMPEVILVGLSHPDRVRDLTPTRGKLVEDGGEAVAYETSGGADKFLAFVVQDLVPWVEKSYRTERFRILAGHSFGGLFALHAMTARPGVFQAAIAASPALTWDGDLPARRVREALARKDGLSGTIVFTVGDEGRLSDSRFEELKRLLAGAGAVRAKALHLAGEDHATTPFATYYAGLKEAFDGWSMPVAPEAVGPRGGAAAVEAHYRALSQRLGFAVPPPERALALAGLQLLSEGDGDGALRTLRRTVELYPSSFRAQHALGAAFERAGELERARDAYRRAWDSAKAAGDRDASAYEASYVRASAAKSGQRRSLATPGDTDLLRPSCDHYGRYDPDTRRDGPE